EREAAALGVAVEEQLALPRLLESGVSARRGVSIEGGHIHGALDRDDRTGQPALNEQERGLVGVERAIVALLDTRAHQAVPAARGEASRRAPVAVVGVSVVALLAGLDLPVS